MSAVSVNVELDIFYFVTIQKKFKKILQKKTFLIFNFSSLTHIADSYRDKSHRSKNGNIRASADSEGSPDELFTVTNRKKPGHLKDNLVNRKSNNADVKNNNNSSPTKNGDSKLKG